MTAENNGGSNSSEAASTIEAAPVVPAPTPENEKELTWFEFFKTATSDEQIGKRLEKDVEGFAVAHLPQRDQYCLLGIYEPHESIDTWDSKRIFSALEQVNPNKEKNVLLLLESGGGRIEPAYQISKICKQYAKDCFVVAVPRAAKSAATLIALGADQIHMGILGELGPIDPQLGDLPALGVKRALETIASICERYPRSADAFAKYMSQRLTIEQIGYCERVAESAVQYAERLLNKKPFLKSQAHNIAHKLVYEYKHHGFVIDRDEASVTLGETWILGSTPEIQFAEKVYEHFDVINFIYGVTKKKEFVVSGRLGLDVASRTKSDE